MNMQGMTRATAMLKEMTPMMTMFMTFGMLGRAMSPAMLGRKKPKHGYEHTRPLEVREMEYWHIDEVRITPKGQKVVEQVLTGTMGEYGTGLSKGQAAWLTLLSQRGRLIGDEPNMDDNNVKQDMYVLAQYKYAEVDWQE